jgi:DNA-binding protein H-NS
MKASELTTIDAQIAELQERRTAILNKERAAKLDEVKDIVKQFGFTASDLGLSTTGRRGKSAASVKVVHDSKYANPADPSQTWHGMKGPRPKWVRNHLDAGGKLEDLLIKK